MPILSWFLRQKLDQFIATEGKKIISQPSSVLRPIQLICSQSFPPLVTAVVGVR